MGQPTQSLAFHILGTPNDKKIAIIDYVGTPPKVLTEINLSDPSGTTINVNGSQYRIVDLPSEIYDIIFKPYEANKGGRIRRYREKDDTKAICIDAKTYIIYSKKNNINSICCYKDISTLPNERHWHAFGNFDQDNIIIFLPQGDIYSTALDEGKFYSNTNTISTSQTIQQPHNAHYSTRFTLNEAKNQQKCKNLFQNEQNGGICLIHDNLTTNIRDLYKAENNATDKLSSEYIQSIDDIIDSNNITHYMSQQKIKDIQDKCTTAVNSYHTEIKCCSSKDTHDLINPVYQLSDQYQETKKVIENPIGGKVYYFGSMEADLFSFNSRNIMKQTKDTEDFFGAEQCVYSVPHRHYKVSRAHILPMNSTMDLTQEKGILAVNNSKYETPCFEFQAIKSDGVLDNEVLPINSIFANNFIGVYDDNTKVWMHLDKNRDSTDEHSDDNKKEAYTIQILPNLNLQKALTTIIHQAINNQTLNFEWKLGDAISITVYGNEIMEFSVQNIYDTKRRIDLHKQVADIIPFLAKYRLESFIRNANNCLPTKIADVEQICNVFNANSLHNIDKTFKWRSFNPNLGSTHSLEANPPFWYLQSPSIKTNFINKFDNNLAYISQSDQLPKCLYYSDEYMDCVQNLAIDVLPDSAEVDDYKKLRTYINEVITAFKQLQTDDERATKKFKNETINKDVFEQILRNQGKNGIELLKNFPISDIINMSNQKLFTALAFPNNSKVSKCANYSPAVLKEFCNAYLYSMCTLTPMIEISHGLESEKSIAEYLLHYKSYTQLQDTDIDKKQNILDVIANTSNSTNLKLSHNQLDIQFSKARNKLFGYIEELNTLNSNMFIEFNNKVDEIIKHANITPQEQKELISSYFSYTVKSLLLKQYHDNTNMPLLNFMQMNQTIFANELSTQPSTTDDQLSLTSQQLEQILRRQYEEINARINRNVIVPRAFSLQQPSRVDIIPQTHTTELPALKEVSAYLPPIIPEPSKISSAMSNTILQSYEQQQNNPIFTPQPPNSKQIKDGYHSHRIIRTSQKAIR